MSIYVDAERLANAAKTVRWWPAAAGLLLIAAAYALVSDRLRVGPSWAVLVVAIVAVTGARVLTWRGRMQARRWVVVTSLTIITGAVTISVAYLVQGLLKHAAEADELLRGGALLWVSNLLTFALWYWEIDAGGPAHRHATHCGSTDFGFPQQVLGGDIEAKWTPEFLDYVFLAFNTSTAFSPTDTLVLARRAKVLMMYQSIVSLVTVVVLVARAINAL
jgi:uncharacterized membrane protein